MSCKDRYKILTDRPILGQFMCGCPLTPLVSLAPRFKIYTLSPEIKLSLDEVFRRWKMGNGVRDIGVLLDFRLSVLNRTFNDLLDMSAFFLLLI